MGPGSRSLRSLGRDDNLSGTALVWPADATSILQHVLQRRDHAQGLVDLLLLLDAGDVVARQDLEHALVGAADAADPAAGIGGELLGPGPAAGRRLGDHPRLQVVWPGVIGRATV